MLKIAVKQLKRDAVTFIFRSWDLRYSVCGSVDYSAFFSDSKFFSSSIAFLLAWETHECYVFWLCIQATTNQLAWPGNHVSTLILHCKYSFLRQFANLQSSRALNSEARPGEEGTSIMARVIAGGQGARITVDDVLNVARGNAKVCLTVSTQACAYLQLMNRFGTKCASHSKLSVSFWISHSHESYQCLVAMSHISV